MTTTSYPRKGKPSFSIAEWSDLFVAGSGIVNAYDATPVELTRIAVGDIARYSVGQVAVGGYVLKITGNEDLTVPTSAGTYYTWACYDPVANVAADGDNNANPSGPCHLGISTGLPTVTGGKQFTLIDRIARPAGVALTAASVQVTRMAPWVGASIAIPDLPYGFTPNDLGWTTSDTGNDIYPLGSTLVVLSTGERFYRQLDGDTSPYWQAETICEVNPIDLRDGLVADSTAAVPQWWTTGGNGLGGSGIVNFEGRVKRSNGKPLSNGQDVVLGDMPVGLRPRQRISRPCTVKKTGSGWDQANVTVGTDGVITMYDIDDFELTFVDLSAITYRTRG